ncbi:amidase [Aurantiacibacter sediminis]|uniref:Amidase n=1 Tax=Aurantiacibacter sediminis TaxID=2793064 RepID=A0ABS0N6L5_9SPHN|nr:amidase [Aurantiacibacter sediminis]MBH5323397.1 amidase [Aurantiacibacter sediminis]
MKIAISLLIAASSLSLPSIADAQQADRGGGFVVVREASDEMGNAAAAQSRRIEQLDNAGPELNAVIAHLPPEAARQVAIAVRGTALDGRTVLVKDNIETREFPTTAGSQALAENDTGRDAPLIERLRQNGGVVLGKTNLSEWANFRSTGSSSGWSAVGGITRNPHAIDRNSCGSSSGSGAAVAAGLSWGAIGTETNGSITCPASMNGVVGLKPTVGLVSQAHIVPISHTQDTAGPMTRSVYDAALLLSAIAGPDYGEIGEGDLLFDFTAGLETASLDGVRIGVIRNRSGGFAPLEAIYEQALADLEAQGAVLVDIDYDANNAMGGASFTVLLYEFREGIDAYLQSSPADIPVRSLEELITFNEANADAEMRWFDQDLFHMALGTTDRAEYEEARATALRLAGPEGLDRMLAENDVAFVVAPTRGPAWVTDLVNGDNYRGSVGAGSLAAIAGYPHLTVPMGHIEGLPVGISFMGAAWDDHAILQAGAAYERSRTAELAVPDMERWEPSPLPNTD